MTTDDAGQEAEPERLGMRLRDLLRVPTPTQKAVIRYGTPAEYLNQSSSQIRREGHYAGRDHKERKLFKTLCSERLSDTLLYSGKERK